jgi:hypothetical protein
MCGCGCLNRRAAVLLRLHTWWVVSQRCAAAGGLNHAACALRLHTRSRWSARCGCGCALTTTPPRCSSACAHAVAGGRHQCAYGCAQPRRRSAPRLHAQVGWSTRVCGCGCAPHSHAAAVSSACTGRGWSTRVLETGVPSQPRRRCAPPPAHRSRVVNQVRLGALTTTRRRCGAPPPPAHGSRVLQDVRLRNGSLQPRRRSAPWLTTCILYCFGVCSFRCALTTTPPQLISACTVAGGQPGCAAAGVPSWPHAAAVLLRLHAHGCGCGQQVSAAAGVASSQPRRRS